MYKDRVLLLLSILTSLLLIFIACRAASEVEIWIDVTHSLECEDIGFRGKDGNCYLGPNDEAISNMRDTENSLKKASEYLWQYNHGRPKSELDGNGFYLTMKNNEGR